MPNKSYYKNKLLKVSGKKTIEEIDQQLQAEVKGMLDQIKAGKTVDEVKEEVQNSKTKKLKEDLDKLKEIESPSEDIEDEISDKEQELNGVEEELDNLYNAFDQVNLSSHLDTDQAFNTVKYYADVKGRYDKLSPIQRFFGSILPSSWYGPSSIMKEYDTIRDSIINEYKMDIEKVDNRANDLINTNTIKYESGQTEFQGVDYVEKYDETIVEVEFAEEEQLDNDDRIPINISDEDYTFDESYVEDFEPNENLQQDKKNDINLNL